jgi:hypothetical protein
MRRRRVTPLRPKRRQRTAIRHEDEEDRELGGIEIGIAEDKAQAEAPQRAREADRRA